MGCPLKVVAPVGQCVNDSKQLPIINVIIAFSVRKGGGMVGAGMKVTIPISLQEDDAVREASVIIEKGWVMSGMVRTGFDMKMSLSHWNAASQGGVQFQDTSFLVKSWRGPAIVEKSGIKHQYKLQNPINERVALTERGACQWAMASSLTGSIAMVSFKMTMPRNPTAEALKRRLASLRWRS